MFKICLTWFDWLLSKNRVSRDFWWVQVQPQTGPWPNCPCPVISKSFIFGIFFRHDVLVPPKSMEMWVFGLYLGQNWTKSHDSSCKMKLFDILNKMEWRKYYVILIFRVQGWLSIWSQILTWSNNVFWGKMVIIGWKYIKNWVE